jgi:hypothetical protein
MKRWLYDINDNMNKVIFLVILFLVPSANLFSQWSTDPNNPLFVAMGWDPKIVSDNTGGCYITYNYESFNPQKLAVERLDRYGYKPWGVKKQISGELPEQWQAEIIEDGEGGVIVSYQDNDESNWPYLKYRVRVQRIDSSGNLLWGTTGQRVTTTEVNHAEQALVSDGIGGCVVVWKEIHSDYTEIYKVNRINGLGHKMWGDSGKILGTSIYSEKPRIVRAGYEVYYAETGENVYKIRHNGLITLWDNTIEWGLIVGTFAGGGIIHSSIYNHPFYKLLAQRKDSLGNNLWQEPYVEVGDSLDINTVLRIEYNNGYYFYSWSGKKNGINRVAQFQALRMDGSKLFPEGSIQIYTPILGSKMVPSESGRIIFIWNDVTTISSTIAQLYDTLGNKLWNESGVIASYPALGGKPVTDGQGGFIICGTINSFTVVAQQVNKYGNIGIVIPVELISFNAKIINNTIVLTWQTATELNNMGFEIERKSLPEENWETIGFIKGYGTTAESKTYSFTDEDVNAGIYKYRLKQIDYDGSFEYSDEVEIEVNSQPKEYLLYQNYPNPFNSSTIIKYYLPEEGRVKLNIYNILGEKALTLFEGEQTSGNHQISLTSGELSSGIYFYSLETVSTKQIKKLTVLK